MDHLDPFETIDSVATIVTSSGNAHSGNAASPLPSSVTPYDPDLRTSVLGAAPGEFYQTPNSRTRVQQQVQAHMLTLGPRSGVASTSTGMKPQAIDAKRYDRVGELGRGGWGVVDRVIDRQLEREVALKRIVGRDATSVDAEVRQRFLHEAKITSQLQHPGVVPVHELSAGDEGDLFYVMKLLKGDTFRQLIRSQHAGACQEPNSRVTRYQLQQTITPLLDRFIDICQAVGYAHEQGIIHRDLKPSNVMVGSYGETIVVDWGLAKRFVPQVDSSTADLRTIQHIAQESEEFFQFCERYASDSVEHQPTTQGTIVGTPAYMSPEQAIGNVAGLGPASDIYSLGVILYEIAAGRHPYQGKTVSEILNCVKSGIWPTLRTVQPAAAKPLEAICAKAMAASPRERYATALQLADDVRRYLAGEATSAYRESIWDRCIRFCRRHQTSCVVAAIATLLLLIGALVFALLIHRAHKDEKASRIAAQQAHQASLHSLADARAAADSWLVELSGSLEFYPGMDPIRNELLKNAQKQYESILVDLENEATELVRESAGADPTGAQAQIVLAHLEEARCRIRLGDLQRLLAQPAKAEKQYALATQRLDQLLAERDLAALQDQRSQIYLQRINAAIGKVLLDAQEQGQRTDTEVRRPSKLAFESDYTWLNQQVANGMSDTSGDNARRLAFDAASCWGRLSLAVYRRQQSVQAVDTDCLQKLERAQQLVSWLAEQRGEARDYHLSETIHRTLAMHHEQAQQWDDANRYWSQLLTQLSGLSSHSDPRPDRLQSLAHARMKFAEHLARTDQQADAITSYLKAIAELTLATQLLDTDSFHQTNLAAAQFNLGRLYSHGDQAQDREALHWFKRAANEYQKLLRRTPSTETLRQLSATHAALAELLMANDSSGAQRHLGDAILGYEVLVDHQPQGSPELHALQEQLNILRKKLKSLETATIP